MMRALLMLAVLCAAPGLAHADPATIGFILAASVEIGVVVVTVQQLLVVALYVYGSARARRKARAAQAKALAEYNANLQDRSITALQALPPWRIVVGRAWVGCDIHAIFTTDKTGYREDGSTYTRPDALKHLVVVFADHQCKAIHNLAIDGVALGPLDGNGFVTSGEFYSARSDSRTIIIGGGGSVSVGEPVTALLNAYTSVGAGDNYSTTDVIGSISLTSGNTVINGPAGATVNYTVAYTMQSVRVQKHLGTSSQAVDSYLNSVVPSDWTSTDRLLNKTYCVVTLDLENQRFQGGQLGITADISGRLCYDPRKDSTVAGGSGAHRAATPSTWEWTDNATIAGARDYLSAEWGFGNAQADIDEVYTQSAATACDVRASASVQAHSQAFTADVSSDELVFAADEIYGVGDGVRVSSSGTLPGGLAAATTYYVIRGDYSLKRYSLATSVANAYAGTAINITSAGSGTHTCTWHDYATYKVNGAFLTEGGQKEALLDDLTAAMAGDAVYGAQWQILAGAWTTPVTLPGATPGLTDDDLAGQIGIVQTDTPLADLVNGFRGTYIPIGKAVPTEYGNYSNATFVSNDAQELWGDLPLEFVDNPARARNIARILVETSRNGQVIQYPAKLRAWPLQLGDRITVTSAEYGWSAKEFRLTDWQFGVASPVLLTLQEDTSSAWDLADAATADATPNTGLPSPWVVQAIAGVTASSGVTTGILGADGSWQPRIKLTWTAITDPYVANGEGRIVILYRTPRGSEWLRVEAQGQETSAFLSDVREGDPVVIEVAGRNGLNQFGPSTFLSHLVTITQSPSGYQGTVLVTHGVTGALSIVGNTVTKIASAGAWDAGVYSAAPIVGPCEVSCVIGASSTFMLALNSDPTTDANYPSLDYAIYSTGAPSIEIYESGAQKAAGLSGGAAGDKLRISYDNTAVRYFVNGTLVRQITAPPGLTLSLDTSFYSLGAKATNIEFDALTAAPRGNLIDTSVWTPGASISNQGIRGGSLFTLNGPSSENAIVVGTDPEGQASLLWVGTSGDTTTTALGATTEADGGWTGGNVPIDPTKMYRWVVKFKPLSAVDAQFYLGCLGNSVAAIATGTADSNPYFHNPAGDLNHLNLAPGRWYMATGYVLPYNYGTTAPSPSLGGLYDMATGQRVRNATDFKWASASIVETNLRTYLFYGVTGASQTWDNDVRLEMVDATIPSIDELLAAAKGSASNPVSISFNDAYALNGQFTNWLLGVTYPDGWADWTNGSTTVTKDTTIYRSGPNAVRVTVGSAIDAGLLRTLDWHTSPPPVGSFVEGTLDCYVVTNTSGGTPMMLVRLYTNSGLTTQVDTVVQPDKTATGAWQRVPFKASVGEGQTVYGVTFYLMGSWASAAGGRWQGAIVFDSLVVDLVQPSGTLQISTAAVSETSTYFDASGVTICPSC